jgi:hypothetical protein
MSDVTDDDSFELTSLFPRNTGLPMTVWVSLRGHLTMEDCGTTGDEALRAWADLNREALARHWAGEIDAMELCQELRRLP